MARRDNTVGLGLPLDAGERWQTETYPPAALGNPPPPLTAVAPQAGKNGLVGGVDWLVTSSTRGCVASISMFESGEASRRCRSVVKESAQRTLAEDNLALAA